MKSFKTYLLELFKQSSAPSAPPNEFQKIWGNIQKKRLTKKDIFFFSFSLATAILCLVLFNPDSKTSQSPSKASNELYIYNYESAYSPLSYN